MGATPEALHGWNGGTSLSSPIDLAVAPTEAGNASGPAIVARPHVDHSGLNLYRGCSGTRSLLCAVQGDLAVAKLRVYL